MKRHTEASAAERDREIGRSALSAFREMPGWMQELLSAPSHEERMQAERDAEFEAALRQRFGDEPLTIEQAVHIIASID